MGVRSRYIFIFLFLAPIATRSRAQESNGRTTLKEALLEQQHAHPSLYQSVPVTQVVPTIYTITYALLVDKQDVVIADDDETFQKQYYEETLSLSGYRASPHLSVSLKRIGLGFSGEVGKYNADYSYGPSNTPVGVSALQKSTLDYRGLGIYLYWIVPHPFGRAVKPSLTVGQSSYAAAHTVSEIAQSMTEKPSFNDSQTGHYRYSVNKSEVGLNIGVQLLKKFTLIPWANYEYIDTSDGARKAAEARDNGKSFQANTLEDDLDLFWHAQNRLKYGIDFSVRLFDSIEVHFGGLLGSIMSGPKSDQISDKSLSLSIAIDQKGN